VQPQRHQSIKGGSHFAAALLHGGAVQVEPSFAQLTLRLLLQRLNPVSAFEIQSPYPFDQSYEGLTATDFQKR